MTVNFSFRLFFFFLFFFLNFTYSTTLLSSKIFRTKQNNSARQNWIIYCIFINIISSNKMSEESQFIEHPPDEVLHEPVEMPSLQHESYRYTETKLNFIILGLLLTILAITAYHRSLHYHHQSQIIIESAQKDFESTSQKQVNPQAIKNNQENDNEKEQIVENDKIQAKQAEELNKIPISFSSQSVSKEISLQIQKKHPANIEETEIENNSEKKQKTDDDKYIAQNEESTSWSNYYSSLSDIKNQNVYKEANSEIKAILDEMIERPPKKVNRPTKIFSPTQKAYFAYRLFLQPENERYLKAEYYYYDYLYKIGSYPVEKPLCIVVPGRNLKQKKDIPRFLQSINRQNYTNFKLIYEDDSSTDDSAEALNQYISSQFPSLYQKVQIVINTQRIYALGCRNDAIRNYCGQNDIVLDVNIEDSFIGKQAFKFVNAIYQDDQLWHSNSVFIYIDPQNQEVTTGPQDEIPMELLRNNLYRGSMVWKSNELRTFRAELYKKISENDFKDESGQFYQQASDVFIQQPIVELSGPDHYKHYYEIFYFYDWNFFDRTTVYKRRHFRDIAWTQTPYNPLHSLEETPSKVRGHVVPEKMQKEYQKNIANARQEADKYHQEINF